jgi:hypothetical protein
MRSIALNISLLSSLIFAAPAGKPCPSAPTKANAASLVGLIPVTTLQDVPILSAPQSQQCTDNSSSGSSQDSSEIPVLRA